MDAISGMEQLVKEPTPKVIRIKWKKIVDENGKVKRVVIKTKK